MPLKRSSSPNHTKFTVVRLDNNLYLNTKNIMNNWKRKKKSYSLQCEEKKMSLPWRESGCAAQQHGESWLWLVSGTLCPYEETSQMWCSFGRRPSHTESTSRSESQFVRVQTTKVPVATVWCVQRFHLAVGVDTCINETLQYELSELVLQSCYCCVERLSHLGHVCWHVGAEILGGGKKTNRKPTHKKNISAQNMTLEKVSTKYKDL